MPRQTDSDNPQFLRQIRDNYRLTMACGAVILLMGLLALASPFNAGLSVVMIVRAMLIIAGIAQWLFAIKASKGIFSILLGAMSMTIGVYMASKPALALTTLTHILAIYLVVSGVFEALFCFETWPVKGSGWALFSGIVSAALGVMIWNQFPLSGDWAIGILLGVKLCFSAWALLMFGFAVRASAKQITQAGAGECKTS